MRCYNHVDRESVGICKHCHKGLCSECAVDLQSGLSCRGEHEQRVSAVDQLVSSNVRAQQVGGVKYAGTLFHVFMGVVFSVYGLLHPRMRTFTVLLGLGFIAFGIYCFVLNRKMYSKEDSNA